MTDTETNTGEPVSQNLDHYDGRWVAVREGLVVADAETEEAVRMNPSVREDDLVYAIGEPPSGFYLINV